MSTQRRYPAVALFQETTDRTAGRASIKLESLRERILSGAEQRQVRGGARSSLGNRAPENGISRQVSGYMETACRLGGSDYADDCWGA